MTKKLKLWFLSLILLIVNLALLGSLTLNYLNQPSQSTQASSVLGVSSSDPIFSPNYIMSNDTFRSRRVFPTQESIQNYLNSVNSPLKNYIDKGQTAAYWIHNAANGNTSARYGVTPNLNPGVLIAYLEKEQSLISLSNYNTTADPENRIRTAMGYGCPDFSKCDTQYYGFANQMNWAAYQLEFNFKLASGSNSSEPYRVNRTITTLDGYNVFLSNEATAANYRYTPHAYWGNYNLWKILTANGWGVDSNTYSSSYIDTINIHRIETPDGVQNPTLKESEVKHVLDKQFEIGHSGGDVILLQRFLRQQGYFTYEYITGYYGNITKTAHTNYLNSSKPASTPAPSNPAPKPEPSNPTPTQPNNPTCDQLANQEYEFGQVDDTVRRLQECLRDSGQFTYPFITGYYGPITNQAQIDYLNATKTPTAPAQPVDPCENLKNKSWTFGVTSLEVVELQKCMRTAGTFDWPWDTGYFGPVTQEALNAWRGQDAPNFSCGNLKGQAWNFGETSERVRQLQACMRSAGVFTWPWDTGYFGDVTRESLIAWRGYF